MIDVDPSDGYYCSWCGEPVEQIKEPGPHDQQIVGTCEQDGIVYVTNEPDVKVGSRP